MIEPFPDEAAEKAEMRRLLMNIDITEALQSFAEIGEANVRRALGFPTITFSNNAMTRTDDKLTQDDKDKLFNAAILAAGLEGESLERDIVRDAIEAADYSYQAADQIADVISCLKRAQAEIC